MGGGISALVLASAHVSYSSSGLVALDQGMDWPLPTPAFHKFPELALGLCQSQPQSTLYLVKKVGTVGSPSAHLLPHWQKRC